MRRVVRSRTYVAQLQMYVEEGVATFGSKAANHTLMRIDRAISQHLAHFPASKAVDPYLGLTVYPVSKTLFVLIYDYDDTELRVHFILPARADRRDLDPNSADW